jgi:hypothetical protein
MQQLGRQSDVDSLLFLRVDGEFNRLFHVPHGTHKAEAEDSEVGMRNKTCCMPPKLVDLSHSELIITPVLWI